MFMIKRIKISKYYILAYLYFFVNSVGLSGGLLFTNLLTPFFYIWLFLKTKQPVLLPLFLVLVPFNIIHLLNGVDISSFLVSNALFISTYIFVMSFSYFINHFPNPEHIFKHLLITNFALVIIACGIYFTDYKELMWYKNKFTASVNEFYRLALFTFEASYYSLLIAPIALYYLLKVIFGMHKKSAINIFILVAIPLLLSLSFGVIAALAISLGIVYLVNWKQIFYKKNMFNLLVIGLSLTIFVLVFLMVFFPDNAIFIRLNNIALGVDTSTRGRTTESIGMAWRVASEKSIWFGVGLGQIKIIALEIVKRYYQYWGELETVRIPNAVAETLAIFGISGVLFRFGLIIYLFFKTKVASNDYRLALFVLVFVYQFTGSYITNIVEYVIWVMAFSSAFPQFNRQSRLSSPTLINKPTNESTIHRPS